MCVCFCAQAANDYLWVCYVLWASVYSAENGGGGDGYGGCVYWAFTRLSQIWAHKASAPGSHYTHSNPNTTKIMSINSLAAHRIYSCITVLWLQVRRTSAWLRRLTIVFARWNVCILLASYVVPSLFCKSYVCFLCNSAYGRVGRLRAPSIIVGRIGECFECITRTMPNDAVDVSKSTYGHTIYNNMFYAEYTKW